MEIILKEDCVKIDNYDNWYIKKCDTEDETNFLKDIFSHMLIEFELLFGKKILSKEDCYIFNYKYPDFPMLITNRPQLQIGIDVLYLAYYDKAQAIYQLSHELCHYILRQTSNGKEVLKWFEETLCESMSLYILEFFSKTWSDCNLSKIDSEYFKYIELYLKDILNKNPTYGLKNCKSIDALESINLKSEENRSDRFKERNDLYNLFLSDRKNIHLICDYQKYRKDDLLIDFKSWFEDTNKNDFIAQLSKIQPLDNYNIQLMLT